MAIQRGALAPPHKRSKKMKVLTAIHPNKKMESIAESAIFFTLGTMIPRRLSGLEEPCTID